MSEQDYINYFETLCLQSKDINHLNEGRKSFFYVDDPYDMDELDNALRNSLQYPAFILEVPTGMFDAHATNYTDTPNCSFSIITKAKTLYEARVARNTCKEIGLKFLARMSEDSRYNQIIPNRIIHFRIEDINYESIGPMAADLYGYMFNFKFVCPLYFNVDAGIWRDR